MVAFFSFQGLCKQAYSTIIDETLLVHDKLGQMIKYRQNALP